MMFVLLHVHVMMLKLFMNFLRIRIHFEQNLETKQNNSDDAFIRGA